jgi:hypothetical protein
MVLIYRLRDRPQCQKVNSTVHNGFEKLNDPVQFLRSELDCSDTEPAKTRFLPLLIAASVIATPGLAAGFLFDLPDLKYQQTTAPITQSTSGPTTPAPARPQD